MTTSLHVHPVGRYADLDLLSAQVARRWDSRVLAPTRAFVLAIRESRPSVQVMVGLRYLTALVLSGASVGDSELAFGLGACIVANTAVYLFNGICDLPMDRVNAKARPLARGELSRPAALGMLGLLVALSLTLASHSGAGSLAAALGLLGLGFAYSWRPMQTRRSSIRPLLLILAAGALTYGWAAGQAGQPLQPAVVALGTAMSLWMALVGGVLKDLSDTRGDALSGCWTLAIRYGVIRVARWGSFIAPSIGVGLLWAALQLSLGPALVLAGALLTVIGCTITAALTALQRGIGGLRRPYRLFMVGQYAVHLTVLATVCACPGSLG